MFGQQVQEVLGKPRCQFGQVPQIMGAQRSTCFENMICSLYEIAAKTVVKRPDCFSGSHLLCNGLLAADCSTLHLYTKTFV